MLFVLFLPYNYLYESLWTSGYCALDGNICDVLNFLDFYPLGIDFTFTFNFTDIDIKNKIFYV